MPREPRRKEFSRDERTALAIIFDYLSSNALKISQYLYRTD